MAENFFSDFAAEPKPQGGNFFADFASSVDNAAPSKGRVPSAANKPDFSDVQSTQAMSPVRGQSEDFAPIGDAPPDFGEAKIRPGEMEAAGKEFRRLGSIGASAATSRALNLGAMLHQGMNPGETVAAKLSGVPDEYTQAGQMRQVAQGIAPHVAADDRGGRFAEMIGGLAPDLAAAAATGGLAELPAGAGIGARALHGAMTMALPAAENTREAYNAAIANGLTPAQAAEQAAVAGGGTLAMGAIPANVPGDLATRALSGAAIAGLQTEGQRRLANAFLPEDRPDLQQPFDAFNLGAGVLTGGVLAGALGHGSAQNRSAPDGRPDSKVIAPGFESHPTPGVPSTDFVADAEGNLREVPRQPELPVASQPIAPAIDPNAGPISRAAAQVTPAHQVEQRIASAPPRFPDAEPGSLAHAANAIDDVPHGAVNPFDSIDPPATARAESSQPTTAEMPQGLANPFDAFPHEPAFRVEPLGTQGLLVHGDAQAARDALAAAGFSKRGRMQDGALRFDAKDRDAIENVLLDQNNAQRTQSPGADGSGVPETQPLADTAGNFFDQFRPANDRTAEPSLSEPADTPSARTSQQPDSPAFQRYFDGSKVVDDAGRPQIVYHGTGDEFTVFDAARAGQSGEHATSPVGHFFTEDRSLAQRYAENASEGRPADERMVDAYLAIKNPYTMPLHEAQAIDSPDMARAVRAELERRGYDGIRIPEAKSWVAFDSGQIKSASENRGSFDRDNPDIRYQRAKRSEAQRAPFADALEQFQKSAPKPTEADAARMAQAERGIAKDMATEARRKVQDRTEEGAVTDGDQSRFQRAPDESARGLPQEEVNRLATGVLKTDADRVGVHVVDSAPALPQAIQDHMQANGIPPEEVKAAHLGGKTYLVADKLKSAEDVQEAIYHDHFTHGGLRLRYGNRLGGKLDQLLHGIGGMDGLRKMAKDQGIDLSHYEATTLGNASIPEKHQRLILMEELLAHLAHTTGTLKRTIQEWVGTLRDWLRRNGFAKLADYGVTDLAHVLKQARQAVIEKAGAANESRPFYMRTPADRAQSETPGPQDRMQFEQPTEDELHEAHSLAKNAVLRKAFDITPEGKENVVRYNGKEVARIAGPVNRANLTKAIAEQIKPVEAKSREQTQTAAPLSGLPARRPGEERGAWLRRLSSGDAGEDVRRATALRAQQKTIGRHAIREMLAGRARAMDTADAIFSEYRKLFDKTHSAQNFANVDAFETGKPIPDADFRAFLTQMKPGFVQRVNRLRELNPNSLQHLVAHYLPHMYENPQRAAQVLNSFAQRNSVAGDKGFLKQREWPTLKQAMDSGLRPITNNPVDWVLLRYAGMDKLIGALELRQELQDRGWLHKVTEGEQIPPGYARVSDPTFNGYAVPANFARDLTNYLDPGFSKYAAWRTLRGAQNFMVAADLGFSGFHATFTSTDNVIMHLDVAARRAAIGDSRGAAATLVKALTSVATSPFEGHKLNQQWRGIREADANTAAILDALERGGARWKMSTTEYQNAIPKMARLFRQMMGTGIRSQLAGKTPAQIAVGAVRVPATALQAVAEMGSYLIHHVLVPNQKMAARVLLYKYELDRRANDLGQHRGDYAGILDAMHPDVVRQIAADVNDVVDFRLGQMAYDNRFWNRTVQDIAQAAVMAPGWQYGMLQTVAGAGKALKDLVSPSRFVAPLDKAGTITDAHMGRVGSNLSYFLTLALTLGGGMAALQYLLTGKGPDGVKDYFFPKTGRKNDDDSDERLQLPNYWVDHYKLTTEPAHTAENKIHPLWKMLWEVGHNRDYFGTRIRDPNAPAWDQALEIGAYMASKFVPITVGNMQKGIQRNESTAQQVGHFFGVNNAPAGVARSEFQNFVMQGGSKGWGNYTRTPEEAQHRQTARAASSAMRRGDEPDFGSLTPKEIANARKDAKQPVPALLFKRLPDPDKLHAYDLATPEERTLYGLDAAMRRLNLDRSTPFKNLPVAEQSRLREKLQHIRSVDQTRP